MNVPNQRNLGEGYTGIQAAYRYVSGIYHRRSMEQSKNALEESNATLRETIDKAQADDKAFRENIIRKL